MDIKLSNLLHDDRPLYVLEGYGAKPINEWPFYTFINQYYCGEEQKARDFWVEWLINQYNKYGCFEKDLGGMRDGSVQRYALTFAESASLSELSEVDIKRGAQFLVDRRIEMMCSIRDEGFNIKKSDRVIALCFKKDNRVKYVLKSGHHRAAALFALGYTIFPNVRVFMPITYNTLRFGKKYLNVLRS